MITATDLVERSGLTAQELDVIVGAPRRAEAAAVLSGYLADLGPAGPERVAATIRADIRLALKRGDAAHAAALLAALRHFLAEYPQTVSG
ncbi:MAG: hypothetical protein AAFR52_02595 [Pseudomonadota bacterium]